MSDLPPTTGVCVDPDDEPTVPLPRRHADLDEVLPVGPSPVMPINPRIRERLVAVRRAQGRKRLRIVVGIVGIVVLAAAVVGLARSPILAVRHVEVTGDAHTPRASVLAVTALDHHPQMIDLSSGRLRRKLMTLPWVASASIQRRWPATVEIRLLERVPVAQVASAGGQPAIVDRDGRVLASGPATGAGVLPVLNGAGKAGLPGSFLSGGTVARAALALVVATQTALSPTSPYQIQGVDIRPDGMLQARLTPLPARLTPLQARLTPRVTVLFGSTDDLAAKLLSLRTLLEQVPMKGPVTLDVRVPTSPVLTHR